MIISKRLKTCVVLGLAVFSLSSFDAEAAKSDIDAEILNQQRILDELNAKKVKAENDELSERMRNIERVLDDIKKQKEKPGYDAEGAVKFLTEQLALVQKQVSAQSNMYEKLVSTLDNFSKQQEQASKRAAVSSSSGGEGYQPSSGTTNNYLVNPGPRTKVTYTQDAINSQGASTMVFAYAENQLYKIYCRTNYLTDIALKKGEKIKFAGGGDTSAWAVSTAEVDGTPHIYIKPMVPTSTTNLIINTDKHTYQLLVNTSDWYNPMVKWVYNGETKVENMIKAAEEERIVTSNLNVSSYENLCFDYDIKGKNTSDIPSMVFNDGQKTIMKYKNGIKKTPALFIREKGKKALSMVNYNVKDNCIIIDRVVEQAELRISDTEIVTVKRKG